MFEQIFRLPQDYDQQKLNVRVASQVVKRFKGARTYNLKLSLYPPQKWAGTQPTF